jgi:hypothetical protein
MVALAVHGAARVVAEVDDAAVTVTHVITAVDSRRQCRRTLKYMLGILRGVWIVSDACACVCVRARSDRHALTCARGAGITASAEAGQWLPEAPFEVQGDLVFGQGRGPTLGRTAAPHKVARRLACAGIPTVCG